MDRVNTTEWVLFALQCAPDKTFTTRELVAEMTDKETDPKVVKQLYEHLKWLAAKGIISTRGPAKERAMYGVKQLVFPNLWRHVPGVTVEQLTEAKSEKESQVLALTRRVEALEEKITRLEKFAGM
jgi:hypothetical protein